MNTVTFNTSLSDRPTLDVTADSELMQNHQAALPVAPEQELMAVYDSNGFPLILSFSPDGDFYAVLQSDSSRTGWEQVDLSTSLKPFGTATSFAAGQLPGGNIFLVASVQDINDATTENLFIAGPLSNDQMQTDWTKLGNYWVESPNVVKGTTVERIFVGPADDDHDYGIPVIAVSISDSGPGTITDYIVRASVDVTSGLITWNWVDFPTPTEMTRMIDYALGSISDLGVGVYTLYEGPGNQNFLAFKTFLNQFDRSYDRAFTLPTGASALQTTPGSGGTTSLFIGGTGGVFWLSPNNQEANAIPVQIASATDVPDVTTDGLIVREDQAENGVTAVWALSGENLFYLHNQEDGGWSTPVLFRQGVAHIAPLRNQQRYANELIYIGTDLDTSQNIYYMWQDPTTTLWKEDHIPLQATDKILEFNCYTTHLSFKDASGNPPMDLTFNVSSDSWLRVIINGYTHIIDQDVSVQIQPDVQGVITIINKVNDLSTPLLHVTGSFFQGTLDVDPAHNVYDVLGKVSSPSDIPILPQTLPSGVNPTDVSTAINNLMQLHPQAGTPQPQADAVVFRPPAASAPKQLNATPPTAGHTFAMAFSGGGFQFHDAAAVAAMPNLQAMAESASDTLKDIGGDILEYLKNAADKVEHFIVNVADDVVTFIVNLGDKVARFTVKTFEEVYKAISWVFNKLKVTFEELIQWLGFLFEWDDIVTTHRVFVNLVNQAFDYAEGKLEGLEDVISNFFDKLEAQVKALEPMGGADGETNIKSGAAKLQSSVPSLAQDGFNFATNSPGGNYGNYHLMHGGVLDYTSVVSDISAPFMDFLNDVLIPTLNSVKDSAQQIITDIKNGYEDGTLTLNQVVEKVMGDLIIGILDAIKTVIVGILKFFDDLLTLFQSAINDEVHIPFLTALYEKYVGSKMSILDGVILLFAVPTTIGYKLITKKAPFADGTYGLDTRNYQELLGQLNTNAPAPQTPAPASAPQETLAVQSEAVSREMMKAAPGDVDAQGDGDSSGSQSNQMGECAKNYSLVGGLIATLLSTAYDCLGIWSAVTSAQAGLETDVDKSNALKASVSTMGKVQVALAMGSIAGSYPVSPGPEQKLQMALWGLSWADLIKSAIAAKLEDKSLAQTIIGIYEIPESLVDLVLYIAILVLQMKDDDNAQKGMDIFSFFPNLLGAIGTGLGGATRVDKDKKSQAILAMFAGGAYLLAGVLNVVEIAVEFEEGSGNG